MSYLKSSFNVAIFDLPEDFKLKSTEIHSKLLEKKFKDLSSSDEFGHGWVGISNLFDFNFTFENSCFGTNLAGGYRYDKKSVPACLLKKLLRERMSERFRNGGNKLSKEEIELLKEDCKRDLIIKALPNPKMIHWIWDVSKKKIFLDAKSGKVIEAFKGLFFDTFGISLNLYDYGINNGEGFLDWLWNSSLEYVWVEDNVVLQDEEANFNFKAPDVNNYKSQINNLKNDGKTVQKIKVGMPVASTDATIIFSDSSPCISIKICPAIKHESTETAILDNYDMIEKITDSILGLIQKFVNS